MPVMTLNLDGDGAFEDWKDLDMIHLGNEAPPIRVTVLPGGMASGKPSVAFGFRLPDRRVVVAETSLALFLSAADVMKAKYGDPRT